MMMLFDSPIKTFTFKLLRSRQPFEMVCITCLSQIRFITTRPLLVTTFNSAHCNEKYVFTLSLLHSTGNKMKPITGNSIKLGCQMNYYGWIFWNVNGYIDSEIQLSSSTQVFQCNHVEFTFWNNAPKGMFDGNQGKLVLKECQAGSLSSARV